MANQLHPWEAATNDLFEWLNTAPDKLATELIGDRRPWEPQMSADDQATYHLEHLYPPQLGGQLDPQYIAHVLTTGTKDEVQSLGRTLDRHVLAAAKDAGLPTDFRQDGGVLPKPKRTYGR